MAPFLDALLRGAMGQAAGWLGVLMATVFASWIATHRAAMAGFELALAVLGRVRARIGDHLVGLPLGWFTPVRTARLGAVISQGVMSLLALPAHQLLPLIRAFVVPAVVIAGMAMMDASLALAAAIALPLVGLTYYWAGRLGQAADRAVHRATEEAATAHRRIRARAGRTPGVRSDDEGLWRAGGVAEPAEPRGTATDLGRRSASARQ